MERIMKTDIKYSDVKRLGFKFEKSDDKVYFEEYGFKYEIITFNLSKYNIIDWAKESRECKILECDNEGNVLHTINISSLEELEKIIKIYNLIKS